VQDVTWGEAAAHVHFHAVNAVSADDTVRSPKMVSITASPNIVLVEADQWDDSKISYEKDTWQTIWWRVNFDPSWSPAELHGLTRKGDVAQSSGSFLVSQLFKGIRPGNFIEVAIFDADHGPDRTDPIIRVSVRIIGLKKRPSPSPLISDHNRDTGGTWHARELATNLPTYLAILGVTRGKVTVDGNGFPAPPSLEFPVLTPASYEAIHKFELKPLFAGQNYQFVALVTDRLGNWQFYNEEFTTLRREFQVEIPSIHIYNDGDYWGSGEGEFWIHVSHKADAKAENTLKSWHIFEHDVDDTPDDTGEKGRTYPYAGFVYSQGPESVSEENLKVFVSSNGIEHDGIFESHERAQSIPLLLQMPAGKTSETIANKIVRVECASTTGDDFIYRVDGRYSVGYVP
jgi:hypothetical protein